MKAAVLFVIFVLVGAFASDLTPSVKDHFNKQFDPKSDLLHCSNVSDVPTKELQLFEYLTDPVRYDRIQTPENYDENGKRVPLKIHIRSYIYYLQNLNTIDLQFKIQMRFQMRYNDPRLVFSKNCSNRTESIVGGEDLKEELWMPHLYFVNEKSSEVLGTPNHDILTSIHPKGTVTVSMRMQAILYCSMNFKKFPFDQQECTSTVASWKKKSSEVKLFWEVNSPFELAADQLLTEYQITDTVLQESVIDAVNSGFQHGDFAGDYSGVSFKLKFKRQVGCYMLEYYFPSMLIIATSWITFWLQADDSGTRSTLGITSMLTFITLSSSQTGSLPKVSYVKASEVWFIACTLFIFASLVEFAFSNLVWRRRKLLDIEKVTTKNLLAKTIVPHHSSFRLNKDTTKVISCNNLTVPVPDDGSDHITIRIPDKPGDVVHEHHLYTHHQVSRLIDKRARVAFPVAFLIFNAFYWTYVMM